MGKQDFDGLIWQIIDILYTYVQSIASLFWIILMWCFPYNFQNKNVNLYT